MHSIKHTRNGSHEFPRKSLEINQNEEFLCKLLSKELHDQKQNCKTKSSSLSLGAEASFRVYYGATANVPFLWESTPGTPKHKSNDSSIPPLTPPPSYSYSKSKSQISRAQKRFSSPRIFSIIKLPTLNKRSNSCVTPTSASSTPNYSAASLSSLFSTSSSGSSPFSPESTLRPVRQPRRRSVFSRRRPQMFARDMDDDEREGRCNGTSKSRRFVCFGGGSTSASRRNGSYTVKNMKKAFSSVVGHRSSRNVIYVA